MTLATHARAVSYGEHAGDLDTATATCAQHTVASPFTDAAGTAVRPIPDTMQGAECVVCPLPGADLIGLPVLSWSKGSDRAYIWGGPPERDGWDTTAYSGGTPVITTSYDRVAPSDTPIPAKDPRVTVEKLPKKRDYQDAGPWLLRIDGVDGSKWTAWRTKKDALTDGLRRVAILDWHAAQAAALVA